MIPKLSTFRRSSCEPKSCTLFGKANSGPRSVTPRDFQFSRQDSATRARLGLAQRRGMSSLRLSPATAYGRRWLRDRARSRLRSPGSFVMAALFFICPKTRQAAWTGTMKVDCPHCREVHDISMRDTYIEGVSQDDSDRLYRFG